MKKLAIITAAFFLIFVSCKKEEEEEVSTTTNELKKPEEIQVYATPAGVAFNFGNVDASLSAVGLQTLDENGVPDGEFNQTVAMFYPMTNFPGAVDVGTVTVNNLPMRNLSGYYYGPDDNQTYNFNAGVTWGVTGGNGFSAFTKSVPTFPTSPSFSSLSSIYTTSNYDVILNNPNMPNVDVIVVSIIQFGEVKAFKHFITSQGIPSSVTFPASQLQGLEVYDEYYAAYAQVGYYAFFQSNEGGKEIVYQNSITLSKPLKVPA